MKTKPFLPLIILAFSFFTEARAGVAFPDPPGGWTYLYNGDQLTAGAAGSGFSSLDGTWSHDNGSDEFDGSEIGGTLGPGNSPGGVNRITEGGATYIRIQDTGDPRDYGFTDPGSNRKIYFGHDMTADGATGTVTDDGVTLTFRARIPTTGPLDSWHRDGQQAAGVQPYPPGGDGYVTSDGGKGNFVIKQANGGAIAFSLTQTNDTTGGALTPTANFAGLTMNEFAGNVISGNVNFGQGTATNVVPFDPTQWHEFWIVLRKDPANVGTHQGFIYMDGSLTPKVFKITAGNGDDYGGISYLALGMTATPQNSALDVDFVGYKLGAQFPPGFAEPPGGWDYRYDGDQLTVGAAGTGFSSLDGLWSHDNGSDEWDGSEIGGNLAPGNAPGGVSRITEGGTTFIRIQDTGDPRDYGFTDPGSNRKIYLGHDMTARGATETQMSDGVTLSFRARIPTTGVLDELRRDGQQAGGLLPYPPGGDGYVTSDGGKGNFVIKESTGGAIAFSLTQTNDTTGGALTPTANFGGLTMNEFAGNAVSGNVNFGQGTATNVIPFNPTEWHTFWITLRKDPANVGTHQAFIYMDGSLEPIVFKVTAGNGSDYTGITYLAMGMTATPQNSALDVDWLSYKLGAHFPGGATDNLPPEVFDLVPAKGATFYAAAGGLSFRATTVGNNSLPTNGFHLTLNGTDVSSQLAVTGAEQNRTVSLSTLQPNNAYLGQLIVRDQAGRGTTNDISFDTFTTTGVIIVEAEDYNHSGGQFIDNPAVGAYLQLPGTAGVDFADALAAPSATVADHSYRNADAVGTQDSADQVRPHYTSAGATEVNVRGIQAGEWLNYTRTFAANNYRVYLRHANTTDQLVRLDKVTGDRTRPNQTTEFFGTFKLVRTGGVGLYNATALTDSFGNPLILPLSGVQTLRLTSVSANQDLNLNYLIFTPATAPTAPQISGYPASGATVAPDAALQVTVFDGPTAITPGSVRLLLDQNDVTSASTVTDIPEGVALRYTPGALLSASAAHTLAVTVGTVTTQWSFNIQNLQTISSAGATPLGSGRDRGFNIRIRQARGEATVDGLFPNTIQRAEAHLADQIIDPDTSAPFLNEAPGPNNDGRAIETGTINYEENGADQGSFNPSPVFPNVITADPNHISMEATAFLELRRGVYRFVGASDDAFRVTTGASLTNQTQILGEWNADRGFAATTFDFFVEADGVYPFRLLYTEGNGGAGIEWYSIDRVTGAAILINDPANPSAIKAFQKREGTPTQTPNQPAITSVSRTGGISFSYATQAGFTYRVESTASLASPVTWTTAQTTPGDGTVKTFTDAATGAPKFYRVVAQ